MVRVRHGQAGRFAKGAIAMTAVPFAAPLPPGTERLDAIAHVRLLTSLEDAIAVCETYPRDAYWRSEIAHMRELRDQLDDALYVYLVPRPDDIGGETLRFPAA